MTTITLYPWADPTDFGSVLDPLFDDLWQPRLGPTGSAIIRLAGRMLDGGQHAGVQTTVKYLSDALGVSPEAFSTAVKRLERLSLGAGRGRGWMRPVTAYSHEGWEVRVSFPPMVTVPRTARAAAAALAVWPDLPAEGETGRRV